MHWIKLGKNFTYPDYEPQWPRRTTYKLQKVDASLDILFNERRVLCNVENVFYLINDTSFITLDAYEMNVHKVYLNDEETEYNYDGKGLEVSLGDKGKKGNTISIKIEYEIVNPRKGLWFVPVDRDEHPTQVWTQGQPEDTRYWLITYDYPNQKVPVSLTLKVPKWAYVIANGKHIYTKFKDDKKITRWELDIAIPTYLIAFAAGKFSFREEKYGDIPLIYVVPEGRENDISRSFSKTSKMIKFFEEYTGIKFPYPKYAQVCVTEFVAGGMENASLTILTDMTLHDEKAHIDFSSEPLVSHELAHQWFGDLVTCKDWSNLWLNEGFATLFEAFWRKESLGEDEFIYDLLSMLDSYLSEYSSRYSRPIMMRIYKYPDELFDAHSYPKAALVIWTLLNIIGEENFRKAIKKYLDKFRGKVVDTEDFRKIFEETTGYQLDWFFEQFIYSAGHPVISFSYKWLIDEKAVEIKIEQKQGDDSVKTYFLPLDIEFIQENKIVKKSLELDARTKIVHIKMDKKPYAVCLDPDFKIFKSLSYDIGSEDLLNILEYSKKLYPRILAVRKIGDKKEPRMVNKLSKYLLDDKEFWGLRSEIAKAISKIGGDTAWKTLLDSLDKVKHPKVRRAIVNSLGSFREEKIGEKLITILFDENESYYVRASAAVSLARNKHEKAFDALKKALDFPSHANVIRRSVLEALGILGTEEALEEVLKYVDDKEISVSFAAIKALGYFTPSRKLIEILWEKAKSRHPHIRRAVLSSIRINLSPRLLPIVRSLKNDISGSITRGARDLENKIMKVMEKGEEYRRLREELEKFREEERRLAEKVEKLEGKSFKI